MVRFVRYEPSQANAVVRSASSVKTACMPFAEALLTISKAEYIRLKWEAEYWQRQHQRGVLRKDGRRARRAGGAGNSLAAADTGAPRGRICRCTRRTVI